MLSGGNNLQMGLSRRIFMGFDLLVYSGNKEKWCEKSFDCFAQFHSHYGSKKNDILLSLLKITLESTADVKEEDWEGLDYDGTTTLSNVKNAKSKLQVQSQSLGLSLEAKEKIENFLDTIIDLSDSEKLYLSWG